MKIENQPSNSVLIVACRIVATSFIAFFSYAGFVLTINFLMNRLEIRWANFPAIVYEYQFYTAILMALLTALTWLVCSFRTGWWLAIGVVGLPVLGFGVLTLGGLLPAPYEWRQTLVLTGLQFLWSLALLGIILLRRTLTTVRKHSARDVPPIADTY